MGPYNIMLKHEVMAADDWHENGLEDLVTVSLCIQIAINKMQLCSLSVAYACPNHPVQLRKGLIREGHTPACQLTSKVSICPLKSVTMPNYSPVKTLERTMSR